MSYKAKYGALLDDIANEADRMAMSYFRGGAMGAERKRDGTVVTQADKRIEQMAIARVKSSGLHMDVVGEETSAEVRVSGAVPANLIHIIVRHRVHRQAVYPRIPDIIERKQRTAGERLRLCQPGKYGQRQSCEYD